MQSIAIITMFRNDTSVAGRWIESFNSIFIPEGVKLFVKAVIGSDGYDSILSQLKADLRKDVSLYPAKIAEFAPSNSEPGSYEYNKHKAEYVAKHKSTQAAAVGKEFTLFWDDDITVQGPIPVIKALNELNAAPSRVNVIGVYPDRNDQSQTYVRVSDFGLPLKVNKIPYKPFQAFSGSPGFAMWKTEYLKSILPLQLMQSTLDTDFYEGLKMQQDEKVCICHGGVRLNHDA